MRKILFVCYDGYRTTNARVRCYRFSNELRKHGMEADVFSFKDDLHASHDGEESFKVGITERVSLLVRAIVRLLKEDKKTVFYIQKAGYFAMAPFFVHLVKGNAYVLDYDDYEYEVSPISKWLLKLLARNAVLCVGASHYLVKLLKQFNKNTYYIPTGVDTDIFSAKSRKKKKKELVFSWLGIIVDEQALENVLFIVDGFDKITKKHPHVRLEIVGGGEYMAQVEKRLQELGNKKLSYLGRLAPDKVPEYLMGIDVGLYILVKKTKYNLSKSPTKLFEYMAMGLAVVASDIGEASYVIDDGKNGLLVRTNEDLIYAASTLVNEEKRVKELGAEAEQYVTKKYSLTILGKKLDTIIQKNLF